MRSDTGSRQFVVDAARGGAQTGAGLRRLRATETGGRSVLLDLWGDAGEWSATTGPVMLEWRGAAAPDGWAMRVGEGLRPLPASLRVVVHEEVSQAVLAVVPPRAVPWRQRLLWATAFALLRSAAGRRWLARRYRD
jgi:hypothetical protein